MQDMYSKPSDLDGYNDLKPEDQSKIQKALEEGHVAEEDIPESAKKGEAGGEEEEEDKPRREQETTKRERKKLLRNPRRLVLQTGGQCSLLSPNRHGVCNSMTIQSKRLHKGRSYVAFAAHNKSQ